MEYSSFLWMLLNFVNKYLKIWYNDLMFLKNYGRGVIMKKKNSYRPKNKKIHSKTIPKLIGSKLVMLLGCIIPIAILIAYSMQENFFYITRILSIFILIISIAAYLKDEIIYSHPKVVHHNNAVGNKKSVIYKKHKINFSFSLRKGTAQVVLSILIIILFTYLGQGIYTVIG